jgi:hypothetical protein
MTPTDDDRDMRQHADDLLRILAEWFGIDPESGRINVRAWQAGAHSAYSTGHELLSMDPTGFSTVLQVGSFLEQEVRDTKVPLTEYLQPTGALDVLAGRARAIAAIMAEPDVLLQHNEFNRQIAAAAAHYAPARAGELATYLAKPDVAVALRVASQLSVRDALHVVQLRDGEPGGVAPKLLTHLYVCHSASDLVRALPALPSSIGMVMFITGTSDYQLHFGIFVVDGERIFLYRDKPDAVHPLQGEMRRRPERQLAERIGKNIFPYELAGIEWCDGEARFKRTTSDAKDLVTSSFTSPNLYPLVPLSDLDADCLIWAALVFDLIKTRVFLQRMQCDRLSYVGRATRVTGAPSLAAPAATTATGLPVPMDMRPVQHQLRLADLTAPDAKALGNASGRHDWLINLFEPDLVEDLLDLAPHYGFLPSLPAPTDPSAHDVIPMRVGQHHVIRTGNAILLSPEPQHDFLGRYPRARSLRVQNPDAIGTLEQLAADRHFIARYNQAVQTDVLLRERFEATQHQINHQLLTRANELLPGWLERLRHDDCWLLPRYLPMRDVCPDLHFPRGLVVQRRPCIRQELVSTLTTPARDGYRSVRRERKYSDLLTGTGTLGNIAVGRDLDDTPHYHGQRGNMRCVINRSKATYVVGWTVNNWQALAELLDWSPDLMPPLLRGWQTADEYIGNQILDRVDPADWVIKHPIDLPIRFTVLLSRKAYRALTGRHDLPATPTPTIGGAGQPLQVLRGGTPRVMRELKRRGYSATLSTTERAS